MLERMIKKTLDEIEETNYEDVLKEAYKKAIELNNNNFSGWSIPIFYNHSENKFSCGSAMSQGSWQPEISHCGKQIDAEVFAIEAQDLAPDYEDDDELLENYGAWIENEYKRESNGLTKNEYIQENDRLREDLESEYIDAVIDDVINEYYEDEFLRSFENYLYVYYLDVMIEL